VNDDVTRILSEIEDGDGQAAEQLLPLVYEELRKLAAAKMINEKPGQTLQATALVHEAYVRLADQAVPQHWDSRRHFFAAAAEAMRRILVDYARRNGSLKPGGDLDRINVVNIVELQGSNRVDLIALDEALGVLEKQSPENAKVVKLRFFAGLSLEETAAAADISRATAQRKWAYARA
jgi:RNA polymerase sigma factor (TIGR02999 family)